jgi:hypothetical protein
MAFKFKFEDLQDFMQSMKIPSRDAYDLPTSSQRFGDGAAYRNEISGIERPSILPCLCWAQIVRLSAFQWISIFRSLIYRGWHRVWEVPEICRILRAVLFETGTGEIRCRSVQAVDQ